MEDDTIATTKNKSAESDVISDDDSKVKLTYAEQKEFETIEQLIDDLEATKEKAENDMAKTNGNDFVALSELQVLIDNLDVEIEEKMNRWDYLGKYAEKG